MRLRRTFIEPEFEGGIYFRKERYEHDPELMEAYECGYADAMKELDGYHERRGNVTHRGMGGRILYREHEDERDWGDDELEYRRRRRANGRFY